MGNISDKNTLVKYLNFLVSFSDQLLEKSDLSYVDINQGDYAFKTLAQR